MSLDFNQDHYALLGMPRAYAIDLAELDRRYLELQSRVHPDKHAHLGESEKRLAMQWATRANEAYQTLKQPLKRARYLLELVGVDPQIENNTAMPTEFLIQQMEWREATAEARDAGKTDELDRLHLRLRRDMTAQYTEIGAAFDAAHDYQYAADMVRRLLFQEKLLSEIDAAIEVLEA
jgi:molecular chaperone HscB